MSHRKADRQAIAELTPLEKVETLYKELIDWYGDASNKEQRVAAKLLMVSLDKLATYEGDGWRSLVMEYIDILQDDPERFQKMIESNRGELRKTRTSNRFH